MVNKNGSKQRRVFPDLRVRTFPDRSQVIDNGGPGRSATVKQDRDLAPSPAKTALSAEKGIFAASLTRQVTAAYASVASVHATRRRGQEWGQNPAVSNRSKFSVGEVPPLGP
jgi:hypothetical protein